jgi:hypothetical protein
MIASLFLLLASLLLASAQPITTSFDFQAYANVSVGLGGVEQAVVQLVAPLTYTANGVTATAPTGSFIVFGGAQNTAIVPLTTTAAAGTVTPVIIGSQQGVYSEVGCGSRSGSNVFYIIGTPASATTARTNDTFYVYRSTDGVTFVNVLDAATTQAWLTRDNEDNTMCAVGMNGAVYSVGSNDTWVSTNQGVTWTQVARTGARFSPRTFFAGGIYTTSAGVDTIMVLGGRDAPSAASPYGGQDQNDVWSSTNGGASWSQLTAAAAWSPRDQHSWAISRTGLHIVFGGDQYGGYGSYYSDMWYSQDGASWTLLKPSTSIGNYSLCELAFDASGYLYLFGGQTNGYTFKGVSVRTTEPISAVATSSSSSGGAVAVNGSSSSTGTGGGGGIIPVINGTTGTSASGGATSVTSAISVSSSTLSPLVTASSSSAATISSSSTPATTTITSSRLSASSSSSSVPSPAVSSSTVSTGGGSSVTSSSATTTAVVLVPSSTATTVPILANGAVITGAAWSGGMMVTVISFLLLINA